jgi:hypothetical protein
VVFHVDQPTGKCGHQVGKSWQPKEWIVSRFNPGVSSPEAHPLEQIRKNKPTQLMITIFHIYEDGIWVVCRAFATTASVASQRQQDLLTTPYKS